LASELAVTAWHDVVARSGVITEDNAPPHLWSIP